MKHNQSQEHMWTKVINAMWEIVTHPPKNGGQEKKFPKRRLHTYEYLFQLLCPKWAGPGFNSPTLGTFQGQLSSVSHELLNLSKLSLPAVWPPSNAILLPSSLLAMTKWHHYQRPFNDLCCVHFLCFKNLFSKKVRTQSQIQSMFRPSVQTDILQSTPIIL